PPGHEGTAWHPRKNCLPGASLRSASDSSAAIGHEASRHLVVSGTPLPMEPKEFSCGGRAAHCWGGRGELSRAACELMNSLGGATATKSDANDSLWLPFASS